MGFDGCEIIFHSLLYQNKKKNEKQMYRDVRKIFHEIAVILYSINIHNNGHRLIFAVFRPYSTPDSE